MRWPNYTSTISHLEIYKDLKVEFNILYFGFYQDNKCMLELKDYLLTVCQDMNVMAKLKSLVEEHAQDVGLLVSQRVVNLPPQLLPPLYDALFDEVEWATEDEVSDNIIEMAFSLMSSSQVCTYCNLYFIFDLLKPTEELQRSFRFKFYLIISKIYKVHCWCHSLYITNFCNYVC